MKKTSELLGALALVLAVLTAAGAWLAKDRQPLLLGRPEKAMEQAEAVMDLLCGGDYAGASRKMVGSPELGADRAPADETGELLWNAFLESLSYEFQGEPYAVDRGLAWDAEVSCLDFDAVTRNLGSRCRELLKQRVARAQDVRQIYDENNEYREDVVLEVLGQAVDAALREDAETQTRTMTLKLECVDGQWLAVPDGELLNVFSWGTVGG